MNDPFLEEIIQVSDALLNAVRATHPDFDLVRKLAEKRGVLLARLPTPGPDERRSRAIVFQQIMAKDAQVRAHLEARQQQVGAELRAIAQVVSSPRHQPAGPSLFDRRI